MKVFAGRAWRRVNRVLSQAWLSRRVRPSTVKLERYGTESEAWWVPADIRPGGLAYCGGVGLDATFDFALVEKKGLEVHSFDPTPAAVAYMERENRNRVSFHPWGMMGENRTVRFHAPIDSSHGSWFADNLHGTRDYFDAECLNIGSIMRRLGHNTIDLLKIDIEGSWYSVLLGMLNEKITPPMVCVEFDSPAPLSRVRKVTRALERAGYQLVLRERDNAVFLKPDA